MMPSWIIAFIVSGGVTFWLYGKVLHRNGNAGDTKIAAGVIWLVGFIFLFILFRALHI